MPSAKGRIALMGSGEFTATMVEIHKTLLSACGPSPRAVFLDTPAGFQLNVDQISRKAAEYFRIHVGRPLRTVSFKSREAASPSEAEEVFQRLRESDFVLMGPGSPTYAVHQLEETPIPEILRQRVRDGGVLAAASAAALTVGRFTLPVYEIYKVGKPPGWIRGLDILSRFGLPLAVIPHWNNAEGGTHDTRFCFMGQKRLMELESRLPDDVAVLGIDEHTACILDLEGENAGIYGIGRVTLRHAGREVIFKSGETVPLERFQAAAAPFSRVHPVPGTASNPDPGKPVVHGFWDPVRTLETQFEACLDTRDGPGAAAALLELDRRIWEAHDALESEEVVSQAREMLREWIVALGSHRSGNPSDSQACLAPLIEEILALRQRFRDAQKWPEADALREGLLRVGVAVEDTPAGQRWHLENPKTVTPSTESGEIRGS